MIEEKLRRLKEQPAYSRYYEGKGKEEREYLIQSLIWLEVYPDLLWGLTGDRSMFIGTKKGARYFLVRQADGWFVLEEVI